MGEIRALSLKLGAMHGGDNPVEAMIAVMDAAREYFCFATPGTMAASDAGARLYRALDQFDFGNHGGR